jgi:hypothetical protein
MEKDPPLVLIVAAIGVDIIYTGLLFSRPHNNYAWVSQADFTYPAVIGVLLLAAFILLLLTCSKWSEEDSSKWNSAYILAILLLCYPLLTAIF